MTIHPRRKSAHLSRGFTLMELMIVVLIMGILASLAVYSVTKYIRSSKTAEAREILASIKAGQEGYFEETYRYFQVTNDVNTYYPSSNIDGTVSIQWGAAVSGCTNGGTPAIACDVGMKTLGVTVAAPVRFRYSVIAGAAGSAPAATAAGDHVTSGKLNLAAVGSATGPWYIAKAVSDLDNDGGPASAFVTTSFQSEIYEENPGE